MPGMRICVVRRVRLALGVQFRGCSRIQKREGSGLEQSDGSGNAVSEVKTSGLVDRLDELCRSESWQK